MLPQKTIRNLRKVYRLLCFFGSVPFKCGDPENVNNSCLQTVPSTETGRSLHYKAVVLANLGHTIFITIRLVQAYLSPERKFFLVFMHFIWTVTFIMVSWLHWSLIVCKPQLKAYCNGLFSFYGSFSSMPGESFTAKERRKWQKKPCVIDFLLLSFLIGAVLNTFVTVQIFVIHKNSYQFAYSAFPPCWRESSPYIIIPFVIYETVLPSINWAVMIFFIVIHLVHLFCTQDFLLMLRKNTRSRILKLEELLHHYRTIQILQNHYNAWIASYMPVELFVVISLTFAGNIGTIRTFHLNGHVSIPEMTVLPMVSILTLSFQIIFYQKAGDLHGVSSYFSNSGKKSLYRENKLAKAYLKSCPPLSVEVGNLLKVRKFTVVRFFGGVVVGTARLSVLFFKWKIIKSNG